MSIFFFLAVISAILDWIAIAKGWRQVGYFTKPGVMIFLLVWVGTQGGFHGPMLLFSLGLLSSLAGDIFLMLPHEQFIAGLVCFLIAHISYTIGFAYPTPLVNFPVVIVALVILLVDVQLYRRIAEGSDRAGQGAMKLPVLFYSIVISLMLLSALATFVRPEWRFSEAALVSVGALLFFISDIVLAWNKFVAAIPRGRLYIRIAYHLGQFGIIFGALLHFLNNTVGFF
jgi:uncharacterized membrane protein YhhN